MGYHRQKTVIIGNKRQCAECIAALIPCEICDEAVMLLTEKAEDIGFIAELQKISAFFGKKMNIYAGDYRDCADAGIIIYCGSDYSFGTGEKDCIRQEYKLLKTIIPGIMATSFSGIIICAALVNNITTKFVWELSGLSRNKIIGTGTCADTLFLKSLISEKYELSQSEITAFVMGGDGKEAIIPFSQIKLLNSAVTTAAGTAKKSYLRDLNDIADKVRLTKSDCRSARFFSAVKTAQCVTENNNSVLTVCTLLDGEYAEKDVFASVPCKITANGISDIYELKLTGEEAGLFSNSCIFIREKYNSSI